MQTGFTNLVNSLEDLQLDVPEAVDLLSRFVMRAITDEVLTPAFPRLIPGGGPAAAVVCSASGHAPEAMHCISRSQVTRPWCCIDRLMVGGCRYAQLDGPAQGAL